MVGNEAAIGLDYHASGSRKRTVMFCMNEGLPALTDRLRLVQEKEAVAYGVVLMHPGVNLTRTDDVWPRDLASIVVRIPALLERSASAQGESSRVYIYDKSDSGGEPLFLGAADVQKRQGDGKATITDLEETKIETLQGKSRHIHVKDISAANKIWTVVILSVDGSFEPDLLFVVLGGSIIGVASMCLAWWIWSNNRRMIRFNRMKAQVNAEKAELILDSARETARAERELNVSFILPSAFVVLNVACRPTRLTIVVWLLHRTLSPTKFAIRSQRPCPPRALSRRQLPVQIPFRGKKIENPFVKTSK